MSITPYGFGPLHGSATTDRPVARAGAFAGQTWFRDASAPGATDGTVADASWLNAIIGNIVHLCIQANINPANDQAGDTYLYDAISAIITAAIGPGAGLTAVDTDDTIDGDGRPGTPIGLSSAIMSVLGQIPALAEAISAETRRATGVEAEVLRRLHALEAGETPRASTSQYGFVKLGAIPGTTAEATGTTGWTLI